MKKSTRFNILIALTYSVTLIGGMYLGYRFLKDQGFKIERAPRYSDNSTKKVKDIINIINKNHVDDKNEEI